MAASDLTRAYTKSFEEGRGEFMPIATFSEPRRSAARAGSEFTSELEDRFIRYARLDTQSDEKSTTSPSTQKQYDLIRLLADELTAIGAQDVTVTKYGSVLATIP